MDAREIAHVMSEEDRARLRGMVRELVNQVTRTLAEYPAAEVPAAGPKPGDVDDECEHRQYHLRRVRAGQLASMLINEATYRCAAEDAATAAWLGASLADLGTSIGSTRQAARKRWPDLGMIYRSRRWLTGHYHDVIHVVRLVLDTAVGLTPVDGLHDDLDQAMKDLRQALDSTLRDLGSGSVMDPHRSPTVRWQRQSELVHTHLREVVDLALPTSPEAAFAIDGARGVLAHYDAAIADSPAQTVGLGVSHQSEQS
jgi:hypothetical protein